MSNARRFPRVPCYCWWVSRFRCQNFSTKMQTQHFQNFPGNIAVFRKVPSQECLSNIKKHNTSTFQMTNQSPRLNACAITDKSSDYPRSLFVDGLLLCWLGGSTLWYYAVNSSYPKNDKVQNVSLKIYPNMLFLWLKFRQIKNDNHLLGHVLHDQYRLVYNPH